MTKIIKYGFSLFVVLFLLIPCSSFGLIGGNPGYDTNIIEKLQKEVPFKIIIPTYFPDGIPHYPSFINGPGEGSTVESIIIGLHFYAHDQNGTRNSISIFEENRTVNNISPDPSIIYLDIGGVQVLEEEIHDFILIDPDDTSTLQMIQGTGYRWNKNGINYIVSIYGYEREECLKIIDSMVKQLN